MPDPNPIVRFVLLFIYRWRLTLLALIGILLLGFFSYSAVLKRESMPAIDVPVGVVIIPYFVNDINQVNEKVTKPIEKLIAEIPEVSQVMSDTNPNMTSITVSFSGELSSQDGMKLVRENIPAGVLPASVSPNYITIEASKVDGEHDMLFAVTGEGKSIAEIQAKADAIASRLSTNSNISEADVVKVIQEEINPVTGKMVKKEVRVGRYGYQKDGNLVFENAVNIGVNAKNSDIGSIELSKAVTTEIEKMMDEGQLKGYKAHFSIGDPSISLNEQIDSLQENAYEALIIVLVVIFFIISWRASLVTFIFIPATFAATFLTFTLIGYSINTMTLFALILVLGLFVDDAIVVVEAIDAQKQKGVRGLEAVKRAITKVGKADIVGTLTTMLVFVPMATISGVMGDFIRLMPITVIIALGLSLLLALSVIPFLSNLIIAEKKDVKAKNIFQKIDGYLYAPGIFITELGGKVSKIINWYLSSKVRTAAVILVSLGLIIFGISFAGKMPFSIFPPAKDGNSIIINLKFPEGLSMEQANETVKKLENLVKDNDSGQITQVNYFGVNERGGMLYAELTPMDSRRITSGEIVEDINSKLNKLDTVKGKAIQPSAGPTPDDYAFQMQVFSEDTQALISATNRVKDYLLGIELKDDAKVEDVLISNIYTINKVDGKRYAQIRAKITESDNQSGNLQLLSNKVQDHYDEQEIKNLGLDKDGLGFDMGMETQMMSSFNSAIIGTLIAILVMYAVLVMQFNSFTQPLLVLFGIPFGLALVIPGLIANGHPMSFFVLIGIIALTGILANNIIMLLDFANIRVMEENKSPKDAIVGAIKRRFRPLLATSTITIAGLLPLALNDPFWAPLALTIIFGLVSCTVLVIFAMPAYYFVLESMRRGTKGFIRKYLG